MSAGHDYTTPASLPAQAPFAVPTDLLIGDAWTAAQGGRRIDVINPADSSVLTSVADGGVADGVAAIDAAEAAAAGWAATPPRARADILLACFHAMLEHQDWLAAIITLENGKALADARGEVAYAAEFFRWYAEEAVRQTGELGIAPAGGNRILVQYQPIGIALLVTPWNFPAAMATRKIAPALAAGCTCILKPAEETPLTAMAIAELLRRAGLPAGVLNLVTTSDPGSLCQTILHDPRVCKLSFTGSTEVGRILLKEAADQVIHCSMELGGNAPFIVLDDADLDAAIEGALVAKMRNGGEACTAANRFYVQRGIHDRFVAALVAKMHAIRVGPGMEAGIGCGAMINRKAIEKIEQLVADAIARGAEVKLGCRTPDGPGFFYPPSILTNVQPGSEILRSEVFGPVAPIVMFDDPADAIALANATEFGLAAYVFTGDLAEGMRLAAALESGMVGLNRGLISDAAAPFGGVKQSGLGREGAHHGLLEYCEAKYVAVNW
jgi:succinate-semialdehyde dehydrogenase/glutarate-semialdehyde dehydrogenase